MALLSIEATLLSGLGQDVDSIRTRTGALLPVRCRSPAVLVGAQCVVATQIIEIPSIAIVLIITIALWMISVRALMGAWRNIVLFGSL